MAKVYAHLDADGLILAIDSDTINRLAADWTQIDEGDGDRYTHAQGNYLPDLLTESGIPRYRWNGKKVIERAQKDVDADEAARAAQEEQATHERLQAAWAQGQLQTLAQLVALDVIDADAASHKAEALHVDTAAAKLWTPGAYYVPGEIVDHGGSYYLVRDPHTAQAQYVPGGEGVWLYIPLPAPGQDGTINAPIAYVYAMACREGLYYTYAGGLYLCKADMIPCVWPPNTAGMWQWEYVGAA